MGQNHEAGAFISSLTFIFDVSRHNERLDFEMNVWLTAKLRTSQPEIGQNFNILANYSSLSTITRVLME